MNIPTYIPIGGFILLLAKLLIDIPLDVRSNDSKIRRRDTDLALWIIDDDEQLENELRGITNRLAAQGQLYSGALMNARNAARQAVQHRYEDQLREAKRVLEDVAITERVWHRVWRRLAHKPLPSLTTPDAADASVVVASWYRQEVELSATPATPVFPAPQGPVQGLPTPTGMQSTPTAPFPPASPH